MDTVLVVGGRTTGLMMASELARRGVPTRCIDKSPRIDPHVRANLLHSRTLEILQSLGLDGQVTLGSVAEKGYVFYRNGERIGESPHSPVDSPFPFGMSQSQALTEATLESHLNSLGVEVERQVSLTAIKQKEDGVTVTLQHDDMREETGHYQWLVACDGAHSAVRHLIQSSFPGESDANPYILGDVLVSGGDDLAPNKGHVFFHDRGELFFFTRLPGNRQFVVANLEAGASTEGTASLEELQSIVTERARPSLRLFDPQWLGYFRISYRLAPNYRRNRVFLAGDAAHVHSLLAGHGMNTGIQDAHNLGWKLALVAKRRANVELLDSYEDERRKVANTVVEATRQITNTMELYAGLSQEDRDKLISNLFTPEHARLDAARQLQEVDLDYSKSALSLSLDDTFQGGPAAGTRGPDATDLEVAGEPTSLFKLPADENYRLFFFCGNSKNASACEIEKAAESSRCFATLLKPYIVRNAAGRGSFGEQAVILDKQGNMHRAYAAGSPCIYLMRPDGYVAYRSSDLTSVGKYFEHLGMIQE
ncbi:MAG: FAD-dependent monooxygenase [Pseudomonadota bacterium]